MAFPPVGRHHNSTLYSYSGFAVVASFEVKNPDDIRIVEAVILARWRYPPWNCSIPLVFPI